MRSGVRIAVLVTLGMSAEFATKGRAIAALAARNPMTVGAVIAVTVVCDYDDRTLVFALVALERGWRRLPPTSGRLRW